MTETTTTAAARRPGQLARHLIYATNQFEIMLGHAELTEIMEMVVDAWDEVAAACSEEADGKFEAVLEHLDELRSRTGTVEPGSWLK